MAGGSRIEWRGSFDKLERQLKRQASDQMFASLDKYGKEGVAALSAATPVKSGISANSWYYTVQKEGGGRISIIWGNDNVEDGTPIVILIQFGHATGTGGYVPGRPFINEALAPIFARIKAEVWKEVTKK